MDRTDEAQLRAWWSAGHAAMSQRPVDLWPDWEISRLSLPEVDPDNRVVLLGAHEDDGMVGSALTFLPLRDNTHLGALEVYVPPDHRRRGVGSALLERAEERRRGGPDDADRRRPRAAGRDSADSRWAEARGYAVANVDTVKVADLAATADLLPGLEAQAAERRATTGWRGGPTRRRRSTSRRWPPRSAGSSTRSRSATSTSSRRRGRPSGCACGRPAASRSAARPDRRRPRALRRGGRLHQPRSVAARAAGGRHRRHARAARPSRPPARPGAEGAAPPAGAGAAPGCRADRDRQRDDQPLDERRQRAARLPAGRPGPRAPEGAGERGGAPAGPGGRGQVRAFWEVERDAVAERPYNDHLAWHAAKTYVPMEFLTGPAGSWRRGTATGWSGAVAATAARSTTCTGPTPSLGPPGPAPRGHREPAARRGRALGPAEGRRVLGAEVFAPRATPVRRWRSPSTTGSGSRSRTA